MSQFVNQDRAKHDEDEKRGDHPGPAAGGMGQGFRKRWTKHDQNERGKKPPRPAHVNWHAGYRSDFEPLFRGHGRGSPSLLSLTRVIVKLCHTLRCAPLRAGHRFCFLFSAWLIVTTAASLAGQVASLVSRGDSVGYAAVSRFIAT